MSPKSNCPPKSQGRLTRVETFVLSAVMIWRLALERLNGLYGLSSKAPIGRARAGLWQRDIEGRLVLAVTTLGRTTEK